MLKEFCSVDHKMRIKYSMILHSKTEKKLVSTSDVFERFSHDTGQLAEMTEKK